MQPHPARSNYWPFRLPRSNATRVAFPVSSLASTCRLQLHIVMQEYFPCFPQSAVARSVSLMRSASAISPDPQRLLHPTLGFPFPSSFLAITSKPSLELERFSFPHRRLLLPPLLLLPFFVYLSLPVGFLRRWKWRRLPTRTTWR